MTATAWKPYDQIGVQGITVTDTNQNHSLGKIMRAKHDTQGDAEFIYLLGVAGTAIGMIVKYNATTYQTVLATNTANQAVPVAVAMSANLALGYGWYQITGYALILKTTVAVNPQVPIFLSGTAGRVKVIASAGLEILNCRTANLTTVVTTTSTVAVMINRPFLQGQIT